MIDTIIIGAGPSGLCMAKTLLEADPDAFLQLLDSNTTLGGVWSKDQIYPSMKTNNLYGGVDFTDFPMDARFGIKEGEHITGEAMHEYLKAYAEHFGLIGRIRLATRVKEVRRGDEEGWDVVVEIVNDKNHESDNQEEVKVLRCKRLVIASGILSVPHMPTIRDLGCFNTPVLHSSEIGPQRHLFSSPSIKNVTVLGGCKSAYDAAHLAASTGHSVNWIIRRSGRGPTWVFPTHTYLGPFHVWREMMTTKRIMSFLSPWVGEDHSGLGWLRRFLHHTSLGKWLTAGIWGKMGQATAKDCRYGEDESFTGLQPEQHVFWYGTATGTRNYQDDILSYLANGTIKVYRGDISRASENTIHLTDGTALQTDLLIAATGYSAKPRITFSPTTLHSDLGIPSTHLDKTQASFWQDLALQSDLVIGRQFPRLLTGPFTGPKSTVKQAFNPGAPAEANYSPWRLYRGIAPPGLTAQGDRGLVFLGMFSGVNNTVRLELQCLWALAYFKERIPSLPPGSDLGSEKGAKERIFEETALFQRYCERRAPYGHGRHYPDLVFDQLAYWDVLLKDLGLETRRKNGMVRELFESYTQRDFEGVVSGWLRKEGLGGKDEAR